MNTLLTTRSIRNILISAAAVSAMTLPILASASNYHSSNNIRVEFESTELASNDGQAELYAKLQNASHKLCSSTGSQFAGSLRQSAAYAKCFEGTLTAAVERLGQPGVSALHLTK
jgi:UrcA family protein